MGKRALKDGEHKDRFERAKAFSDYLGFHIRSTLFLVFGFSALAIPISNLIASANGGPVYIASDHLIEIGVSTFCFSLSLSMIWHIFGVGRSYLRVHLPQKVIRRAIYPIYGLFTAGALVAISVFGTFELGKTLGTSVAELECGMNRYLSQTNYPFTPEKPEYCE